MKATGIVRRIDDLGRVVIPKEIRRTLKIREGEPMEIFTDAGGSWYTDAVIWAYHAGVVAGVSATQFAPNEALTREQMVTMLYGYAGRDEQLSGSDGALASYQDQVSVSGWAREAMAWAVSTGVITGTSTTTLAPQKIGTRAEVATVLMQFCEQ